ncbi:Uncharacterized conserved protein YbbC, DUF1343 family [Verrucomicrobium sp. GAS474]|uniref:exo-beta-N-acetylmuramidase NamZ family protein n=1 Tax=Verrucomicrobium sp. GAS474 TaxID=1882831 RepID=UPI00087DADC3|nr:DUF1343 domain-containing protein [Verrucomicrobium sp. GAS474]SDU27921.1 Uncharacterized conserved protein YbbC, DUF1343 family [Verrucomicrobium sp. GAS474]
MSFRPFLFLLPFLALSPVLGRAQEASGSGTTAAPAASAPAPSATPDPAPAPAPPVAPGPVTATAPAAAPSDPAPTAAPAASAASVPAAPPSPTTTTTTTITTTVATPAPSPPAASTAPSASSGLKVVRLGIDVLAADDFKALAGKRVGLITNQSGVNRKGISTIDVLRAAPNVKLVALYGPEHGVYGAEHAGLYVASSVDTRTSLPVYSLYGDTKKPTPDMLKDIDVLVLDIQDIGARSYTFIGTMALAMEACGEAGKEFMVLDRPNPIGGNRVEGMPLGAKTLALDLKSRSLVGNLPIPYVHGLTMGELAQMIVGEGWIKAAPKKLTVIPMKGWKREMTWKETNLAWVPPSPHIPTPESTFGYVLTGLWGDIPGIANGVGYTLPFGLVGGATIDRYALQKGMEDRKLPGMLFIPTLFQPFYFGNKDKLLSGVQVICTDPAKANLMTTSMALIEEIQTELGHEVLSSMSKSDTDLFDKLCGGDTVRLHLIARKPVADLIASWQPFLDDFRVRREKYLLYKTTPP